MQGNQRQQFQFQLCDFLSKDTKAIPAVTVNPRVESSSSFSTQESLSEAGALNDRGTCSARSAVPLSAPKSSLCSLDTTLFPYEEFPKQLLFPTKIEPQKQMKEESVGGYLNFCKTNSLAEHWAMLQDQVAYDETGSVQHGWIAKNLKKFQVQADVSFSSGKGCGILEVLPHTEKKSLHELMGALVIVNGRLGMTSGLKCWCDQQRKEDNDYDGERRRRRRKICNKICDGKHASPVDCKHRRWFDVNLGAFIAELFGSEDEGYHATQKRENCVYSFGNARAAVLSLNAIRCINEHANHTDASEAADCGHCTVRLCEMLANPCTRVECALLPLIRIPEATNLNEEQRKCLLGLRYSLEAVQGPPGTGKTTFIHAAVQALSAQHPQAVTLVSCIQNQAIENVALRFATATKTLPFIVLAQQHNDSLGKCARYWTLDSQVDRDPEVAEKQAQYLAMKARHAEFREEHTQELMEKAWEELRVAKGKHRTLLVSSARAVLATVTSSANWLREAALAGLSPTVQCVVLDEAGYAPDAQMPQLLLFKAQLLLLVGDHKQLPPFARGFAVPPVSLLERVFLKLKDQSPTLTRQYRMHPRICTYVSKAFYSSLLVCYATAGTDSQLPACASAGTDITYRASRLITDPSVRHREMNPEQPGLYQASSYAPAMTCPVWDARCSRSVRCINYQGIVLDLYKSRYHDGPTHLPAAEIREGTSYWNNTEVIKTMLALRHLHLLLPASKTMAVISFYKAQVLHLKDKVSKDPSLQALVESQRLSILSVDACQGSEADVVILNCVRSARMSMRRIPFFANKNRFCVATSRAKHLLLFVGSSSMVQQQGNFFEHVQLITSQDTGVPASAAGAWWQILSEKLSRRDQQRHAARDLKQLQAEQRTARQQLKVAMARQRGRVARTPAEEVAQMKLVRPPSESDPRVPASCCQPAVPGPALTERSRWVQDQELAAFLAL